MEDAKQKKRSEKKAERVVVVESVSIAGFKGNRAEVYWKRKENIGETGEKDEKNCRLDFIYEVISSSFSLIKY